VQGEAHQRENAQETPEHLVGVRVHRTHPDRYHYCCGTGAEAEFVARNYHKVDTVEELYQALEAPLKTPSVMIRVGSGLLIQLRHVSRGAHQ
jgi:hypothetical protein